MPVAIRAILFDFDGLIIDTETAWFEAFVELYREHGLELSPEQYSRCIGTTFEAFDPYAALLESKNATRDELRGRIDQLYKKRMVNADLRPGVRQYIRDARNNGLHTAIVSSSHLVWIESYIERFQLADSFDLIMTADRVQRVKPDPELYVRALSLLGVAGSEAIAFEDSLNGLKAAKAAGVHCVVVPNPVTLAMPFESAAYDGILQSMADKPLKHVIEAISSISPRAQLRIDPA